MRSGFLVSKNPIKFRSWPSLWNFTELLIRVPVLTFLTSSLLKEEAGAVIARLNYAGVVMMEMVVTDDEEDDVI